VGCSVLRSSVAMGKSVTTQLTNPHSVPAEWGLTAALMQYPQLSVVPTTSSDLVLAGSLRCHAANKRDVEIDATYTVELRIPRSFPGGVPRVFETGGVIPMSFHRNPDGSLCLGAPTALQLALSKSPTIIGFIGTAVIPYLYGHAYNSQFGGMPFGELKHGSAGVAQYYRTYFRVPASTNVAELLLLAGLRRRVANKRPCPCGSGRRLGRCHHLAVNRARSTHGRAWFRRQAFDESEMAPARAAPAPR